MNSKSLPWRLLLAFTFISVVAFVGSYGASQVAGQSAEQIVYIPLVSVFNGGTGEEEPPVEPPPTPMPTPEPPAEENVFYLSPSGNDANDGATESKAWATFNRAWVDLYPGDTLIMLDGVYNQTLWPNKRGGEPGHPITILAKNDGQAIIDGQNQLIPIYLSRNRGNYYVIEGIVAKNSEHNVIQILGHHNTLRRISAYDANTDTNTRVINLGYGAEYNLLEDCVAAGSGRKTISIFEGAHNTIRRCFANWQEWDGREFCQKWPNGQNIQIYHGTNNIIENSIAFGPVPNWSFSVQANDPSAVAVGNKILGSFALFAGANPDGTLKEFEDTRPQPTNCTGHMWNPEQIDQRSGFRLHGSGNVRDNLYQDLLAWGNAGVGISTDIWEGMYSNNQLVRATMVNNGLDNPWAFGGVGVDAIQSELDGFDAVTDSLIETLYTGSGYTSLNGEGARLTHRYVDGVLTDEPLWPWPMEGRIQAELGISVTDIISGILAQLP